MKVIIASIALIDDNTKNRLSIRSIFAAVEREMTRENFEMADGLKIVIKISPGSQPARRMVRLLMRWFQSRSGRVAMTVSSPDLVLPE